jgi:hypothetical protein
VGTDGRLFQEVRDLREELLGRVAGFGEERVRNDPCGAKPLYSPLIAITGICGKRLRTMERSSKPDILGIFRSEMMMSGGARRSSTRAAKPSVAVRTSYPFVSRRLDETSRIDGSSSTTRIR